MKDLNKADLPSVKPPQQTNGKVSDLDGKPPEETDYANYFCECPCAAVCLATSLDTFVDPLPVDVSNLRHHKDRCLLLPISPPLPGLCNCTCH